MATENPSKRVGNVYTERFTVKPLGPSPSDWELRNEIEKAFAEAFDEAVTPAQAAGVKATVEPEGGFFGAGLELWLLAVAVGGAKAAGAGAAAAVGKKLVDKVWGRFEKRLQARNILVEKAAPQTKAAPKKAAPKKAAAAKKKPRAAKRGR